MQGSELLVVVLVAVLAMTWTARRLNLSEPLCLLAGGVLIGLAPPFHDANLPPDLVLLFFLPALLYWESLTTSLREIKSNLRSIALQSTVLVLVTALVVAGVAHVLGYGWPVAFVLGAVLAPTDAAAVSAVATAMPRRFVTLLRTESLLNDGTALVLLAVGVEVLSRSGPFSWSETAVRFVESYAGGACIGVVVALVLIPVRQHVHERILHSGLSVATPFIAYVPAQLMHVSGVLAVVVCGLVTSQVGPRIIASDARLQAVAFWEVTTFLVNGALFVLVGIQTPTVVRALTSLSILQALAIAAAISACVIATRLAWFYTAPYLIRLLDRSPRQRERRISARQRLPLAWAGMRGGVSLAAALTIPATTADGRPLQQRDAVVFITVVVIVVTLALLGPTLPAIVRRARFGDDTAESEEEDLALRHIAGAALERMPVLADRYGVPQGALAHIAKDLRKQAVAWSGSDSEDTRGARQQMRAVYDMESALLGVKRAALRELHGRSRIDDIVMRRVQGLLDIEEQRLATRAVLLLPGIDHGAADGEDRR